MSMDESKVRDAIAVRSARAHSADEVFVLNPEASLLDLKSSFEERFGQAEAMALVMADGDFEQWADEVRSDYIWALRRKIEDLGLLHKAIMERVKESA